MEKRIYDSKIEFLLSICKSEGFEYYLIKEYPTQAYYCYIFELKKSDLCKKLEIYSFSEYYTYLDKIIEEFILFSESQNFIDNFKLYINGNSQ